MEKLHASSRVRTPFIARVRRGVSEGIPGYSGKRYNRACGDYRTRSVSIGQERRDLVRQTPAVDVGTPALRSDSTAYDRIHAYVIRIGIRGDEPESGCAIGGVEETRRRWADGD